MFTEKQKSMDELEPVTQEMLRDAYERVSFYTECAFKAGIALKRAKGGLETKVLVATFEGKIQGKNEGERKAVAMQFFQQDYADIDAKEYEYETAAHALAIARIRLDYVRDCIRIEELAKK